MARENLKSQLKNLKKNFFIDLDGLLEENSLE
jgi:hypothetical protein